jgi:uncharacterized protein
MNALLKVTCTILLAFSIVWPVYCQDQEPSSSSPQEQESPELEVRVWVMARTYGDSIVLRWAPDDPVAWSVTNRFGYIITKRYVDAAGEYIAEVLTPEPLMPWPIERMMAYFSPGDTIAAIAAELIHGEGLAPADINYEETGFVESLTRERDMQQTRFAFALQAADFSPKVAEAMALRFSDTHVTPGVLYDYLVTVATPKSVIDIKSGSDFVVCKPFDALLPPEELDVRQIDNNRVELAWSRDEHSGYFVERSQDGGNTFQRVNHKPYYSTSPDLNWNDQSPTVAYYSSLLAYYHIFPDTVTPGITYQYRVQGIDAFSDITPFTDAVVFTPVDLQLLNTPVMLDALTVNDTLVKVTWRMDQYDPMVAGFHIEKGPDHAGPWEIITPELLLPNVLEYVDMDAPKTSGGYYRVVAVGYNGTRAESFAVRGLVEDFDAPSVPTGLTGVVYYDGIVELFWDDSPEADLKGYRVAYANQADHEFVLRTPRPITENYFRDSIPLQTLTRKIYYKILAEDLAGNRSSFTEVVELVRPDIIPPVVPIVIDARQDAEHVFIVWSLSPSDDIMGYRVFRKLGEDGLWDVVRIIDVDESMADIRFTDGPEPATLPYFYAIEAIDRNGNSSGLSRYVEFTVRGKRMLDIPIELTAIYDELLNGVKLHWQTPVAGKDDYYFVVLKSTGNSPLVPLTTLSKSDQSYTDAHIQKGIQLRYAVQLQMIDGRRSTPGLPVEVIIP